MLQKFLETKEIDTSESKENCIKTIIESTLKNGRMKCLKSDSVLDNLSYEIETVIEGEYYTIEESGDEDKARVEAIMKNINYSDALEHLSNQVFADVYVEAHLYDVAVMGLSHIPLDSGFISSSTMRDRMTKYYFVSFRDNIENRINDEDIFFDGVDMNEDVDTVFEAFADSEYDAKSQYLRLSAEYTYEKQNRLELIKRECAARVIRRIVAGEIMLLPREVLACENISQILTKVYDVVAKLQSAPKITCTNKVFREMAKRIDLDDFISLLDRESVITLYMELYGKDVFVQEMVALSE